MLSLPSVFIPYSTFSLIVILLIFQPDQLKGILFVLHNDYGLTTNEVLFYSFTGISLISLVVYAIKLNLDDRRSRNNIKVLLDSEKNALIHFYNKGNGQNWKNKRNWCDIGVIQKTTLISYMTRECETIRSWKGISCNEAGRVVKLTLADNNIQGRLFDIFDIFN